MRFLHKLIALLVYAALLLPISDGKLLSSMKAVEVASTALDRTLRRRKSSVENAQLARFLRLMHALDAQQGDFTWRWRPRRDRSHRAA